MAEYFHILTAKPAGGDAGAIAEGHYIVKGQKVFLTDEHGVPLGEGRSILRDPLFTARQMLRDRLLGRRLNEPNHRPIQYPKVGWR